MPQATVHFYQEAGAVPVYDRLLDLKRRDRKTVAECIAKIRLLAAEGHALRRPHADYLRDGIYELRSKRGRVNFRILYFYHGKNVALLVHGLTKKRVIPAIDIERAMERKRRYASDPKKHQAIIALSQIE